MNRFRPTPLVVGGMYETENGDYVLYNEHLAVVQKLEELVRELEACYTDDLKGAYDKGYQEGHEEGHSTGYSKGLSFGEEW